MGLKRRVIVVGVTAAVSLPVNPLVTTSAMADCVGAGSSTVCAQGSVRGGGPTAPVASPAVPYPCEYDWYCGGWDITGIDIGRPGGGGGRPGGGGGIGPR